MLSTLLKYTLHFSGLLAVFRTLAQRPCALVLRYHSVAAPQDRAELYLDHGLTLHPEIFERQLQFFTRHYTIVPLKDIVNRLRQGLAPYNKAMAITFDDGFRDNYLRAFPLLHQYKAPATFYLTTGCIDNQQLFWVTHLRYMLALTRIRELRTTVEPFSFDFTQPRGREEAFRALVVKMKNIPTSRRLSLLEELIEKLAVDATPLRTLMMSWQEVREMHNQGMSFGAHTVTHPNLPNTSLDEAKREICTSKETIEAHLQASVLDFSYPNGRGSSHLTEQIKDIVRHAGFHSAVTSIAGGVELGHDPFALKRVGVYKKHGVIPFLSWEIEANRWQG